MACKTKLIIKRQNFLSGVMPLSDINRINTIILAIRIILTIPYKEFEIHHQELKVVSQIFL
jgi:hypothetical protein